MAAKRKPPAGWRPGAVLERDQAERLIFPEISPSLAQRQARRLALRYGLPITTARTIASLAYAGRPA
jgi:hypothetical protein